MLGSEISLTRRALTGLHRLSVGPPRNFADRLFRRASFAAWMTLNVSAHPNSSGHRVRAAVNLWAWQAWRRVVRKPVIVCLPCGAKLRCPPWSKMAGAHISIGYHEEEVLFLIDMIRDGEGFIDVGANMGVYSMVAAARGARVLAFEPADIQRALFEENVLLNEVSGRVRVLGCALSDACGSALMTQQLDNMNHLIAEESTEGECSTVEVKTLDAVMTGMNDLFPKGISLLKIDAEGFDLNVLRGATDTLRAHRPAVIIEVWAGGRDIKALLSALDYRVFHYDARRRALEPIADYFSGEGYFVAVHATRLGETRQRVTRAPKRESAPFVQWLAGAVA